MPDQAPIIVDVEGVGEIEFPAGTSQAQIKSALMNVRQKVKKQTGTTDDASSWTSALADIGIGVIKGVGQTVVGAGRLVQMVPGVTDAVDALYGTPGLSSRAMGEADKALTPSNTAQSVGKMAEQIGETVLTGGPVRQAGQFAVTKAAPVLSGIVGQGAARLIPKVATEAAASGLQAHLQGGDATTGAVLGGSMPAVAKGLRAGRNAVFGGSQNPRVVQEAVEFGMQRGVPIDAATATGRPIVQKAQKRVTDSMGGARIAEEFKGKQTEALQRVGDEIADAVHPSAVSPEQAGRGVIDTLEGTIAAENKAATRAYSTLRQLEELPANTKRVQVGTQTLPDGTVQAVMEDVAMPVDMRPVKEALRPVLEAIEKTWPITKKDASSGLVALRNLVQGADAVSASTADANLGLIKKIVREAESPDLMTRGQALAAQAVGELEGAVQRAVADAGPQATQALRAGRDATIRKYTVAELRETLRDEPVQVFESMIYRKDAGIDRLREVAKLAPGEMPKVGRAYIEQALQTATAEGGFDRALGLLRQWQNLGPETKKLLFPNPLHRKDLDDFFLLAKKIAENPNPSNTAGQLTALNVGFAVPANILARAFYSPAGVRQLTKGISTGDTSAVMEALGRVTAGQTAQSAR